jgi:hypothetical protein
MSVTRIWMLKFRFCRISPFVINLEIYMYLIGWEWPIRKVPPEKKVLCKLPKRALVFNFKVMAHVGNYWFVLFNCWSLLLVAEFQNVRMDSLSLSLSHTHTHTHAHTLTHTLVEGVKLNLLFCVTIRDKIILFATKGSWVVKFWTDFTNMLFCVNTESQFVEIILWWFFYFLCTFCLFLLSYVDLVGLV